MAIMQLFARWLAVGVTRKETQLIEFQSVAFLLLRRCTTIAPPLCIYRFEFGRLHEKAYLA
jgi:hypothetical protein